MKKFVLVAETGSDISPEMAAEFDVPEFVIDYKYEAMAVRKYHVPRVELPTFDKVFGGW